MPIKFDHIKFQSTQQGIVGRSDVDPESDETYHDVIERVDEESAERAGFDSREDEIQDLHSRTTVGADHQILSGQERVNSPNANFDATQYKLSPNKRRQVEAKAVRNAVKSAADDMLSGGDDEGDDDEGGTD